MGIELGQGCHHSSVSHTLHVNCIDIILLHLLKNEIELSPSVIVSVKLLMESGNFNSSQGKKHSQEYTQERNDDSYVNSFHSYYWIPVKPGM